MIRCHALSARSRAALAATTCFAVLAVVVSGAAIVQAAEPTGVSVIGPHLEAGEFGLAQAIAANAPDAAVRDQMFREIAAAQAGIGSRRAAVGTASFIGDDVLRSRSLSDIGSTPINDRFFGGGGRGGGPIADFDSLIELITTTIAPESWDEVGGPGAVDGFEAGVYVDAAGVMHKLPLEAGGASLASVRNKAAESIGNTDVRRTSRLRKVSLTRLEKQAQMLAALGHEPDDVMRSLAGIYKIQYVLVYPETGDIVIAGPAGDWIVDAEGRQINVDTRRPVLQLDDFVACLRNAYTEDSRFGCSITPRKEGLAAIKAFLEESSKTPLPAGDRARRKWLDTLQATLGKQDIEVYGIDPRTHAARVLVEADYRMKLVGMGLEEGTAGVKSYLDSVALGPGGAAPPMNVLRWWFTLNYKAITATETGDAFELNGQGVKVLSENELLTELGERVHTGTSDELNREFSHSFTKHFAELAMKYPIYAELQNVFDLALVSALIKSQDLPAQVDWHMTHFGPAESDNAAGHRVELAVAPKEVDTVINHRTLGRKHIFAQVSGGVSVDAKTLVAQDTIQFDNYGLMKAERAAAVPKDLPRDAWWWD